MNSLDKSVEAPATAAPFPAIDARTQEAITDDQARFFRDHGLMVIRHLVHSEELATLQRETGTLIDRARQGVDHPDYRYGEHAATGQRVPFRIEYVIDKSAACRRLLAHPFILRTVEKLLGPDFITTGESMVFKNPGAGMVIPWHRDAGATVANNPLGQQRPTFNVDIYLDRSDLGNCLWGILGSNRWPDEQAARVIAELNAGGFNRGHGAIPIPMEAGDILLHSTTALHGSPPTQSQLRRVLYYEFRPADPLRQGSHYVPEYVPLKRRLLLACQRQRSRMAFAVGERPYSFSESADPALPAFAQDGELPTYRHDHQDYWKR